MVSRGKTREIDSVSAEAEIPEEAVKKLLDNNHGLYRLIADSRERVKELIRQGQPLSSFSQTPLIGKSLQIFIDELLEEERPMIQKKKECEKRISSLIKGRIKRKEFDTLENRIINFCLIEGMGIGEAALRVAEESEGGKYEEAVKKVEQVMERVKEDLGIQADKGFGSNVSREKDRKIIELK